MGADDGERDWFARLGRQGSRLPLVMNVGFAGHREVKDEARAGELLDRAFSIVEEAFRELSAQVDGAGHEHLIDAYEGPARLRLVTGEAPGADRLAIARWRAAAVGDVHPLYPYRDGDRPLTDQPGRARPEDRLPPPGSGETWTGFDPSGWSDPADGHEELGRWIARWSDLLVALWDGAPAKGPGGTGETVRRTLERGVPVLWLRPGDREIQLLGTDPHGRRDGLDGSGDSVVAGAIKRRLIEALELALSPPRGDGGGAHDPEVASRLDYARVNPLGGNPSLRRSLSVALDNTAWKSYRLFQTLAAGALRNAGGAPPVCPPRLAGLEAFEYIDGARAEASARSRALSNIHRSEQLLLILLAMFAVFVGAAPALWKTHHVAAAAIELALGAIAFVVAWLARRAHRHRRWGDARRLSERLRAAKATWPLGVDIAQGVTDPPETWTEWRARAILRAAGPRPGWLDRDELDQTARWIMDDLVEGQFQYHRHEADSSAKVDRLLRRVEGYAFVILMASLSGYLLVSWTIGQDHFKSWAPGLISIVSAGAPAVGAAALALEGANGFGELALRSRRAYRDFQELRDEWSKLQQPSLQQAQQLAIKAARLVVENADAWRDRVARTPIKHT